MTFEFTHKTGRKSIYKSKHIPIIRSTMENIMVLLLQSQTLLKEKNLRKSPIQLEAKFKAVFDYASIGLAILNNDLQIIDANKKMCDKLQYSKAELLNINYRRDCFTGIQR